MSLDEEQTTAGDTFVIQVASDQEYRPVLTSLRATRDVYMERLVKSGKSRELTRSELLVLDLLLQLVNGKHWKASGELFAFPNPESLDAVQRLSNKMGLRAIRGMVQKSLVEKVRRSIEAGLSTAGYLLIWPPDQDCEEWTQHFGRSRNSRMRLVSNASQPGLFPDPEVGAIPPQVGAVPPGVVGAIPPEVGAVPPQVGAVPPKGGTAPTSHNNERAGAALIKRIELTAAASADVARPCARNAAPQDAAAASVEEIQSLGIDWAIARTLTCPRDTLAAIRNGIRLRKPRNPGGFALACLRDPGKHINPDWYPASSPHRQKPPPTFRAQREAISRSFAEADRRVIAQASDEDLQAALDHVRAHAPMGFVPPNWRDATPKSLRSAEILPFLAELIAGRLRSQKGGTV